MLNIFYRHLHYNLLKILILLFSMGGWANNINAANINAAPAEVSNKTHAIKTIKPPIKNESLSKNEDHAKFAKSMAKTKPVEEELENNKQLIQKLKKQLQSQHLKESDLMKQLQSVEAETHQLLKEVEDVDTQLEQSETELATLQTSVNSLNQSFQDKLKLFTRQMKAAYFFKRNRPLKLFLSQQNPQEIDRMMQYYHYIEKYHYETLSQLLNEMHTLSVHQKELDSVNVKIKDLKTTKLAVLNNQKAQKEVHQKALQLIKKDLTQTTAAMEILQQNEKILLSQLSKIQTLMTATPASKRNLLPFFKPAPFTKAEGKLLWPIRKEPRPSLMSPFMIKAQKGESVHATYEGRVIFADRLRGFGLLIILDHGEGYMSLYGHNQTLYKNVGDNVKQGDMIAKVGSRNEGTSSEANDSGLYFEIRKNGKPTNLVNWFN